MTTNSVKALKEAQECEEKARGALNIKHFLTILSVQWQVLSAAKRDGSVLEQSDFLEFIICADISRIMSSTRWYIVIASLLAQDIQNCTAQAASAVSNLIL